ncbi:unnamed protein product, partial [Schistosoma mattheei]
MELKTNVCQPISKSQSSKEYSSNVSHRPSKMNNSTKVSQKSYDSLQSSSSSLSNKPKLSQKEINKIIERLTKYDETIGPPESNNAKIYLGYGRYEYPHRK